MDNNQPPPWLRRATLEVALGLLGFAAVLWVLYRLRSLVFALAIALFVSIALEPAVQFRMSNTPPGLHPCLPVPWLSVEY